MNQRALICISLMNNNSIYFFLLKSRVWLTMTAQLSTLQSVVFLMLYLNAHIR